MIPNAWRRSPRRPIRAARCRRLRRPVPASLAAAVGSVLLRSEAVLAAVRMQRAPAAACFWGSVQALPQDAEMVLCAVIDTLLIRVFAERGFGSRLIYDALKF